MYIYLVSFFKCQSFVFLQLYNFSYTKYAVIRFTEKINKTKSTHVLRLLIHTNLLFRKVMFLQNQLDLFPCTFTNIKYYTLKNANVIREKCYLPIFIINLYFLFANSIFIYSKLILVLVGKSITQV